MKKRIILAALLFTSFYVGISCAKKTEEPACKTCRAFSVDGVVVEAEVCSEAEETAFRNDNAGREISCQ